MAELIEKNVWSSPAGKKRLAKRLVAMLPPHAAYCEPFAGSAAVFFEKEPVDREALNDADPEIADAYRAIKALTPQQLTRLKRLPWTGDAAHFKKTYALAPKDAVGRLYRFLYVARFSYGHLRKNSFNPGDQGTLSAIPARVEKLGPRLKKVHLHGGDYEPVVRKYDSKDTCFFLDPPYAGYNAAVGEGAFDEERFFKLLKGLKGKFLLTYGTRGKLPGLVKGAPGFVVKTIRPRRSLREMRGVGGAKTLTQLVVTNYEPPVTKLDDGFEETDDVTFTKAIPFVKADERYIQGIVLEPETEDAQGDVYSVEEVRAAAHKFMEDFQNVGLMHRMKVNEEVKILESYLAPAGFSLGEVEIKEGTWLLAVRVLSDDIWSQVQDGKLTGFSIGGSARRNPEPAAMPSGARRTADTADQPTPSAPAEAPAEGGGR
jgi:DNA adenine methylase